MQAFAALGHGSEPKLLEDPLITGIAQRVKKTPAQVSLAWGIQRGTALLTTSTNPSQITENFEVSTLVSFAVLSKLEIPADAVHTNGDLSHAAAVIEPMVNER